MATETTGEGPPSTSMGAETQSGDAISRGLETMRPDRLPRSGTSRFAITFGWPVMPRVLPRPDLARVEPG